MTTGYSSLNGRGRSTSTYSCLLGFARLHLYSISMPKGSIGFYSTYLSVTWYTISTISFLSTTPIRSSSVYSLLISVSSRNTPRGKMDFKSIFSVFRLTRMLCKFACLPTNINVPCKQSLNFYPRTVSPHVNSNSSLVSSHSVRGPSLSGVRSLGTHSICSERYPISIHIPFVALHRKLNEIFIGGRPYSLTGPGSVLFHLTVPACNFTLMQAVSKALGPGGLT